MPLMAYIELGPLMDPGRVRYLNMLFRYVNYTIMSWDSQRARRVSRLLVSVFVTRLRVIHAL